MKAPRTFLTLPLGLAAVLATVLLAACLHGPAGSDAPAAGAASALACAPAARPDELGRQAAEVQAKLAPVQATYWRSLEALEQVKDEAEQDLRRDLIVRSRLEARRRTLAPLIARGNAEAMVQLADDIRERDERDDVVLWLALTKCASQHAHPTADDELVRWYWHQKGDGSIEQVQQYRKIAMSYAGKAAMEGSMFGITRLAVYMSGDIHQYPADPGLGRELLELCARTDSDPCEQALVGRTVSYDYRLPAAEKLHWLSRLAARQPERFASERDRVWASLTSGEQAAATRKEEAWRPTPWASLQEEWQALQDKIFARGQASVGSDTPCNTATPWCRGQFARVN